MSSAGAGQNYIENPVKLANGENIVFSFGTIGDRSEDRVAFWERLEDAEREKGRVQSRLIMELPHEASSQARFEMVKTFCKRFEDMGLPFWAVLHAPGKGNDSRNFHAHVVFSERPAKRMVDPKDGVEKWDFECKDTYRTSSRNTKERRPFRQNRHPFFRPRTMIDTLRQQFADDANAVLQRVGVKDQGGAPVLYDARSYKDMGVDIVPMKSVNRIVADKMQSGKLTVLDRDFTKKMIRVELQEALARRDSKMIELIRLEETLQDLAKNPDRPRAQNKRLPKELQVSFLAQLTKAVLRTAATKIIDAKRTALSDDLMEQSTRVSLKRIIEATDAKVLGASAKNTRDPVRRQELPSEEAARLLNEAAREELHVLETESVIRRRRARYRMTAAVDGWRQLTGPSTPAASPIIQRELESQSSTTAAPKRATPTPTPSSPTYDPSLDPNRQEFHDRVRRAGVMASAIIAEIDKLPTIDERMAALASLLPKRARVSTEPTPSPEAPRPSALADPTPKKAPEKAASTGPTSPAPPGSAEGVAPTVSALTDDGKAARKRERRKRERRAMLAKRRRDNDRGR